MDLLIGYLFIVMLDKNSKDAHTKNFYRYKDAAEDAAKALEIEPHNTEVKILKKNVELIQRALSSSKVKYRYSVTN